MFGCAFDMDSSLGVASMIHGGLMMAVGIPLFAAGAYQIPKKGSAEPPRTAEVRVGPSRADLMMTW
jgi:hypothetical protein